MAKWELVVEHARREHYIVVADTEEEAIEKYYSESYECGELADSEVLVDDVMIAKRRDDLTGEKKDG